MDQKNAREPNPLLEPWTGPFGAPPFDRLKPSQFEQAFDIALGFAQAEIAAIAAVPNPPSFANTIEALERSGRDLTCIRSVFFNLARADTNDEIEAIEREIAPKLARHRSEIYLNDALFRRIEALYAGREKLGLDPEQARVLERYQLAFLRNGGGLPDATKARLSEIVERLATLGTKFGQNILADEKAYMLVLSAKDDLVGLPASLVSAAARTAADRGLQGKHGITCRVRASRLFCNSRPAATCGKRRFAPGRNAANPAG
jgi:peptidyl-dipeptidase Dcp